MSDAPAPSRPLAERGPAAPRFGLRWALGSALSLGLFLSGALSAYRSARRAAGRYRLVVLTYHRVAADGQHPEMTVHPRRFRAHMRHLKRSCAVVTLEEAFALARGGTLARDTVAITFDDGFRDVHTNALPVLRELHLPATVFLIAGRVGDGPEMLGPPEIDELRQAGVAFGSHSVTHPVLAGLDRERARFEIAESKRLLEAQLGAPVPFFAYPKGKRDQFDEQSRALAAEAGYRAAFTTENGAWTVADDPFAVPRLGMRDVPVFVLRARLSGVFESAPVLRARRRLGLT